MGNSAVFPLQEIIHPDAEKKKHPCILLAALPPFIDTLVYSLAAEDQRALSCLDYIEGGQPHQVGICNGFFAYLINPQYFLSLPSVCADIRVVLNGSKFAFYLSTS